MEWVYLTLALAFLAWAAQMVLAYRRGAEIVAAQVAQARSNQEEILLQAECHETQAEEKKAELEELKGRAAELGGREKELQASILSLKQKEATRRPTRHKVQSSDR